jgi:hypothetical protein
VSLGLDYTKVVWFGFSIKMKKNDIAIVCFANCDVPDTIDVKLSEIDFE